MKTETKNKAVYFLKNIMYINLTNLCTNNCVFCLRNYSNTVGGVNLWLDNKDPSPEEVIEEIQNNSPETRDEIVFCGYGEPLIKLENLKKIALFIKQNYSNVPVRINSNGQANLIHKRNIVPEITGLVDKISISLNADNPDLYQELSQSKFKKEIVYDEIKFFISECAKNGIETTATVVTGFKNYSINVENCKKIALELGAKFKIREWLESGYS